MLEGWCIFLIHNVKSNAVEKDWSKAILPIANGEKIPEDLEKRLVHYKKDWEGTSRRC